MDELDPTLTIDVTGGMIEGVVRRGLRMWRGIPYAAPPTGARRLRGPQPVEPWDGIRDAAAFGPIPVQDPHGPTAVPGILPARMSEDCLTLNVIAPVTEALEPRPVMVYLYGGAFAVGSSREMPDQGEGLVHDGGVVFVNLNYRVGALGFLDLSRYGTDERPIDSNLGLRDCLAALEWVRDNIAAFGGDPHNVTLFGESAGAALVTTLMTVERARGLFARTIAESAPVDAVYDRATSDAWAAEFLGVLRDVIEERHPGVTAGRRPDEVFDHASSAAWVSATQRLSAETLTRRPGSVTLCMSIDDDLVPRRPAEAFADGSAAAVPMIIGTNDREGTLFRGRLDILATTPDRIRALLVRMGATEIEQLLAAYPGLPRRGIAMDFAGDHAFWYPSVRAAAGHSRYAPTYMYRFDLAPRMARVLGLDATHGIELFAVFDQSRSTIGRIMGSLGGAQEFERTGRRVRTNWLHFAYSGKVDAGWPAYDEEHRRTLVIDVVDRVVEDPRGARRRAWERFIPHL